MVSRNKTGLLRCSLLLLVSIAVSCALYNISLLSKDPTDNCTWADSEHGLVEIIEVNRPDDNGLKNGDILISIGGENVTDEQRAQMILDNQAIGDTVSYVVMRDMDIVEIGVPISRMGLTPVYTAMALLAFVFLLVGLWIGWMRPLDLSLIHISEPTRRR